MAFIESDLFLVARDSIVQGGVLVDVGPGIRPQQIISADRHICIEPHWEYADYLDANGYEVIRDTGLSGLNRVNHVDSIVALDVIEHMEKQEGVEFLRKAVEKAKQVIVFTPFGFLPQEETGSSDAWGMNGQKWQRHRSGWLPSEFEGWRVFVDKHFHLNSGAFIAIKNQEI
jgi:hypothetical protein